ncbi:hypothetical protein IMZ48_41455 [Candidatus Bathyarchaeota archaeon]|nr:hypothetical protein [Candidatus Bathyarchaeota archaeon]
MHAHRACISISTQQNITVETQWLGSQAGSSFGQGGGGDLYGTKTWDRADKRPAKRSLEELAGLAELAGETAITQHHATLRETKSP